MRCNIITNAPASVHVSGRLQFFSTSNYAGVGAVLRHCVVDPQAINRDGGMMAAGCPLWRSSDARLRGRDGRTANVDAGSRSAAWRRPLRRRYPPTVPSVCQPRSDRAVWARPCSATAGRPAACSVKSTTSGAITICAAVRGLAALPPCHRQSLGMRRRGAIQGTPSPLSASRVMSATAKAKGMSCEGDDLVVQIRWQCDQGCIFLRIRSNCDHPRRVPGRPGAGWCRCA